MPHCHKNARITVTSNHINLLAYDNGRQAISKSMQLIAGRTAQEYNNRKQRKGAFWQDHILLAV
jgi:putative transposase